jgi:hypothetical protein
MRGAHTLDGIEDGWRDFLATLERVWKKAERECQVVRPMFQLWQKHLKDQRASDPLLQYLRHARNADSHTIEDTLRRQPRVVGFGPTGPGVWKIDKLAIKNGRVTEYAGNQSMKVSFVPERLELLAVSDRGVTYSPPASHQGVALAKVDPISVAAAGLAFYEEFVAEAERRFFGSGAPGV